MYRLRDVQTATYLFQSEFHSLNPNSAVQLQLLRRWHADPIVSDCKFKMIRSPLQSDGHPGRMGMAMDVDERLLCYPEQSHCSRPVVGRQIANQRELYAAPGSLSKAVDEGLERGSDSIGVQP